MVYPFPPVIHYIVIGVGLNTCFLRAATPRLTSALSSPYNIRGSFVCILAINNRWILFIIFKFQLFYPQLEFLKTLDLTLNMDPPNDEIFSSYKFGGPLLSGLIPCLVGLSVCPTFLRVFYLRYLKSCVTFKLGLICFGVLLLSFLILITWALYFDEMSSSIYFSLIWNLPYVAFAFILAFEYFLSILFLMSILIYWS